VTLPRWEPRRSGSRISQQGQMANIPGVAFERSIGLARSGLRGDVVFSFQPDWAPARVSGSEPCLLAVASR